MDGTDDKYRKIIEIIGQDIGKLYMYIVAILLIIMVSMIYTGNKISNLENRIEQLEKLR